MDGRSGYQENRGAWALCAVCMLVCACMRVYRKVGGVPKDAKSEAHYLPQSFMASFVLEAMSFPTSKDKCELISGDWYKSTIKVLLQGSALCKTVGMPNYGRDLIYCWLSRMGAQKT